MVSPNILFLLDFSENTVRPAYGFCSTGDCTTNFVNFDDFSSTDTYYGYFDSVGAEPPPDPPQPKNYTYTAGKFEKNSAGAWKSNWLNWLTMTQFDVLKQVAIGGDISPAPEQANPGNMPLRSRLNVGKTIYKTVKRSTCEANAPSNTATLNELCDNSVTEVLPVGVQKEIPQVIPYKWINLPATGVNYLWRNTVVTDENSKNIVLPFSIPYYGNTFTNANISDNGFVQLVNDTTVTSSYFSNYGMPYNDLYNNVLAIWWDDLAMRTKNADEDTTRESLVAWHVNGVAPHRALVVTWQNIYPYYVTNTFDYAVTFQMLLFEDGNIIFQYKDVDGGLGSFLDNNTNKAISATIGIENGDGTKSKFFSQNGSKLVSNNLALFMTPEHNVITITPKGANTATEIKLAPPLDNATNTFAVEIEAKQCTASIPCNNGSFFYRDDDTRKQANYDHILRGLVQDLRDSEKQGDLGFRLAIMQPNKVDNDGNTDGGMVIKHFNDKDTTGWPSLMNTVRSQPPTGAAPLAEALHMAQGYFRENEAYKLNKTTNATSWAYHDPTSVACSSTGTNYDPYCFKDVGRRIECAKSYVMLISSGNYSHDFGTNIDGTTNTEKTGVTPLADAKLDTPLNFSKLEQVAYKGKTTDLRSDINGNQFLQLYAIDTYGGNSGAGTKVMKRAAVYGGFDDKDKDGVFDDDGTEDNFITPRTYKRPEAGISLKAQIISAVNDIMKNSASGTSVSVLSTSAGGEGALYQAYFYPAKVQENDTTETRWPGYLRAFFLDRQQRLRDDSGGTPSPPDAALVPLEDKQVVMELNTDSEVVLKRYTDSGALVIEDPVKMDDVISIWEGGTKLAKKTNRSDRKIYFWLDTDGDGIVDNGDFGSQSGEARQMASGQAGALSPYLRAQSSVIQTVLTDVDADGNVISEVLSSVPRSAEEEAAQVINYTLGNHVDGYRGRCVNFPGAETETGCSSGKRIWPLGDIIFSTPTLVSVPGERYGEIYGDASYRAFTNTYNGRRSIVYAGANDGQLHAFNAGVYKAGNKPPVSGTDIKVEAGWFEANAAAAINGWGTAEIGDELWSFVPYDNLPHLAWLACNGTNNDPVVCGSDQYTHVYYVDHRPKVTDARIFADGITPGISGQSGASHPNGWGTILIMPMRLGGGAIDVTADFGTGVQTRGFKSAYYAFDITDPEKKPKLLWRFGNKDGQPDLGMGFTTSYPSIVRINNGPLDADGNHTPGPGDWFMIVGSGPKNAAGDRPLKRDYNQLGATAELGQPGKIYVVNLKTGELVRTFTPSVDLSQPDTATAIMGDPTVIDADLDFGSDVIYIGSAISTTGGRVYRINTNRSSDPTAWQLSVLFDPNPNQFSADPDIQDTVDSLTTPRDMGPLLVGPSASKDIFGNLWVFFGTGRLKSTGDLTNADQQRFYGIKDRCWKNRDDALCSGEVTDTNPFPVTSGDHYAYTWKGLLNANAVKILNMNAVQTDTANQVDAGGTGICDDGNPDDGVETTCSYQDMLNNARLKAGWYVNLDTLGTASERMLARSSVLGGLVLFTAYRPVSDICSIFGNSNLYGIYYESGTSYIRPIVAGPAGVFTLGTTEYVSKKVDIGVGMPTSVGIAIGETVSGFVQKSTGEIIRIETQPGLGVRSGVSSWREKTDGGGTVGVETIYKHIVK